MSDLTEYTHLLNLYTWFNEASIQGLLSGDFNGNYGEAELQSRVATVNLQTIRTKLASPSLAYLFNKPLVGVSAVEPVPVGDIQVAALRPGIGKVQLNDDQGSGAVETLEMTAWKLQGWQSDSITGLYYNNFQVDNQGLVEDWIGIAVYCLEVVLVVLVKTGRDNSVPPNDPSNPSEPSGPGSCQVDGIEFCDEEEDDCLPDPQVCANFTDAY